MFNSSILVQEKNKHFFHNVEFNCLEEKKSHSYYYSTNPLESFSIINGDQLTVLVNYARQSETIFFSIMTSIHILKKNRLDFSTLRHVKSFKMCTLKNIRKLGKIIYFNK